VLIYEQRLSERNLNERPQRMGWQSAWVFVGIDHSQAPATREQKEVSKSGIGENRKSGVHLVKMGETGRWGTLEYFIIRLVGARCTCTGTVKKEGNGKQ